LTGFSSGDQNAFVFNRQENIAFVIVDIKHIATRFFLLPGVVSILL